MSSPEIVKNQIVEFFRNKAYAYTQGQLRYVSFLYEVPCQFTFGTHLMKFETSRDVENALKTYRDNLLARNYNKTTARVEHIDMDEGGRIYCLVTYQSFDVAENVLSIEHVSYFLEMSVKGIVRIVQTEYLDEPNPLLFSGMDQLLFPSDD